MTDTTLVALADVHRHELIGRIRWAVRIRWGFVSGCMLVAAFAASGLAPFDLDGRLFAAVGLVLALANVGYWHWVSNVDRERVSIRALRGHCLWHVLGDYLALMVVVHALGSIETPIMFMVLPNLIFGALFFTRRQSLLITLSGLALVSLPPLAEAAGLLAPVRLFATGPAASVALALYLLVFYGVVLFCWYLVTEITSSLLASEAELEASYRGMLLLDEEKTRAMLAGTHELKAPLAAIKSYVYTLRDGYAGELPERARRLVLRIGERCDRLLLKITDVMRLANLKSYVVTENQFVPIDLGAILTRQVALARQMGEPRSVIVVLALPGGRPVRVMATEEHLETLLSNLLSNAVNYSCDGGEVRATLIAGRDRATVRIEDEGIGMNAEQLAHVFDEHYRTEEAVAHHESGTGLGLPIVRETARLLGASVELESHPGRGTRAILTIPREQS